MRQAMVLLLFSGALATGADLQAWNEVDVVAHLSSHLQLTAPAVIRDSFSLANPQLAGGGAFLDLSLTKYVSLTGGYLFVALPNTGKGYNVSVPLAAMTLRHAVGRFKLADRNRAERLIGIPQAPIRYRNRVSIEFPELSARWTPFLTDEFFFDFSQSAWTQNRFQAGVARPLSAALKLDAFFLERTDLKQSRSNVHALGLTLEIHLPTTHTSTQTKGSI